MLGIVPISSKTPAVCYLEPLCLRRVAKKPSEALHRSAEWADNLLLYMTLHNFPLNLQVLFFHFCCVGSKLDSARL